MGRQTNKDEGSAFAEAAVDKRKVKDEGEMNAVDLYSRQAARIFLMSGLVCLACAILLNGCLVSVLDPNPPIDPVTRDAIGASQWRLALFGFAFAAVYWMVGTGRRFGLLKRLFGRLLAAKLLLSVTAVGLPILLAELCLRPVYYRPP